MRPKDVKREVDQQQTDSQERESEAETKVHGLYREYLDYLTNGRSV